MALITIYLLLFYLKDLLCIAYTSNHNCIYVYYYNIKHKIHYGILECALTTNNIIYIYYYFSQPAHEFVFVSYQTVTKVSNKIKLVGLFYLVIYIESLLSPSEKSSYWS